jgi:hypothetical protein
MVAGMILRDNIVGHKNNYAHIFTPQRSTPIKSIPKVAASYLGIN